MIHHGDLFDVLPTFDAESVDACVTDPPYGIGFMGREWDTFKPGTGRNRKLMHPRKREAAKIVSDNPNIDGRRRSPALSPSQIEYDMSATGLRGFQAWTERWAREVLRVLKPGAYAVVCGAPRSFHRMTCGLEDAGFEIRDCLSWLYGQGFPKSLNVGDGRGTALKPGWEPIVLARKPMKSTVAANLRTHGTGALNIDACRVDFTGPEDAAAAAAAAAVMRHRGDQNENRRALGDFGARASQTVPIYLAGIEAGLGRWPANVILDADVAALLDEQTGELTSGHWPTTRGASKVDGIYESGFKGQVELSKRDNNSGGVSRFYKVCSVDCILCGLQLQNRSTMSECKNTSATDVELISRTIHRIIAATALRDVPMRLVEQIAQRAPSVESLCGTCVTSIVVACVAIRHGCEPSKVFPASIPNYKSSTLVPSLVSFAGLWANIDITPTTESLSLLFGSVCHAIGNCTRPASLESASDQLRFLYSAKPSREERDFGCEGLPARSSFDTVSRDPSSAGANNPRAGAGRTALLNSAEVVYSDPLWVDAVLGRRLQQDTDQSRRKAISGSSIQCSDGSAWSMCWCGSPSTDPYHPVVKSIIETETSSIIESSISNSSRRPHTNGCMAAVFGVMATGGNLAAYAEFQSPWAQIGTSQKKAGRSTDDVNLATSSASWLISKPENGGGRRVEATRNFHPT